MNLVKAELRKLVYSRSTYGLLLASIFVAVLSTVVTAIVIDQEESGLFGSLKDKRWLMAFTPMPSAHTFLQSSLES
jgi:ABC-type transport system involved in multi-copper enzyme maturation permease subunit